MSKAESIRNAAVVLFQDTVKNRVQNGGTVTDRMFRKNIIMTLVEKTGCTIPAASTHYNYAKLDAEKNTPTLVVALGRPEGKNNGGRKKKPVAAAPATGTETPASTETAPTEGAAVEGQGDAAVGQSTEEPQAPETPVDTPAAPEEVAQQLAAELVNVIRVKDGEVVAEGLTTEAAEEMIEKAKAAKKAKLAIQQ